MLDNYQRAIIEKMQHSPRNLIQLAQLLKMIDERPGLAHYNYCGLLDIHEVTFYRNLKTLRTFGLVHPTKYKLNPKAELATPTAVVEETGFDKYIKQLPVNTIMQRHAVAVAKNPTQDKLNEVQKLIADTMSAADIQKFLDLLALFQIANGTYHNYADKETEGFVDYETLQDNLRELLS